MLPLFSVNTVQSIMELTDVTKCLSPHDAQVLSKGHLLGPAGIEVKLSRVGTDEKPQSVVTQPGGK